MFKITPLSKSVINTLRSLGFLVYLVPALHVELLYKNKIIGEAGLSTVYSLKGSLDYLEYLPPAILLANQFLVNSQEYSSSGHLDSLVMNTVHRGVDFQ